MLGKQRINRTNFDGAIPEQKYKSTNSTDCRTKECKLKSKNATPAIGELKKIKDMHGEQGKEDLDL